LILSPLTPRKAKTAPEQAFCRSCSCALDANPVMPLRLCKALHKRNYVERGIMRSLERLTLTKTWVSGA